MEFYAKGQLSFLILTCLLDRDFYGLDIISEISSRSNGKINLKKPSVYSNLKRMQKQGYVSAYLRSSDFGPNRKYYSLTEKGRGFYRELKAFFDYNKIDVFRDFVDIDIQNLDFFSDEEEKNFLSETKENQAKLNNKDENESTESTSEQDDDFFDFSSLDETQEQNTQKEIVIQSSQDESPAELTSSSNAYDESQLQEDKQDYSNRSSFVHYSLQAKDEEKDLTEEVNQKEEKKDDAVFLPTESTEEYNRRLFDISKDINKIKRKRSFAEDQIAITAVEPLDYSNEKKKANLEEFKTSLLDNKNKYNSQPSDIQIRYRSYNQPQNNIQSSQVQPEPEKVKDDAKFITERIDKKDVATAKKIEPPKLKIVSENTKDVRLPAPKRDANVDPSHREILNRLYSKTKDGSTAEMRADKIYDYDDLKEFYESQNISFDIYRKNIDKKEHNTNLLYLFISLGTFLITALLSSLLYVTLLKTNMLNGNTTFLYLLLPLLLIIDVTVCFYNYKVYSSWIPKEMMPQWRIWIYTFLVLCVIVGFNLIFGIATKAFSLFATTLLLPILITLIVLPLRYYITKIVIIKYWK